MVPNKKYKNVFERRAEELQDHKRTDEAIFAEDFKKRRHLAQYKAPYLPTSWFKKFLEINRRQKIDRIDKKFIHLHIVGSRNESKVISALRFLKLIDEGGYATPYLASLRVIGDDFKKNLASIIRDAYNDLVSTIVLDVAKPTDLINFFIQRYDYSQKLARDATRFFVWLALQSEIVLSLELSEFTKHAPQIKKEKNMNQRTISLKVKSKEPRKTTFEEKQPSIQTTVTIHLDKDTPREYWDRVLALLGEKQMKDKQGIRKK